MGKKRKYPSPREWAAIDAIIIDRLEQGYRVCNFVDQIEGLSRSAIYRRVQSLRDCNKVKPFIAP